MVTLRIDNQFVTAEVQKTLDQGGVPLEDLKMNEGLAWLDVRKEQTLGDLRDELMGVGGSSSMLSEIKSRQPVCFPPPIDSSLIREEWNRDATLSQPPSAPSVRDNDDDDEINSVEHLEETRSQASLPEMRLPLLNNYTVDDEEEPSYIPSLISRSPLDAGREDEGRETMLEDEEGPESEDCSSASSDSIDDFDEEDAHAKEILSSVFRLKPLVREEGGTKNEDNEVIPF